MLFLVYNMNINKLASAIYNDIKSGLAGYSSTDAISIEQLEDDIIDERLLLIKKYGLQNKLPFNDLRLDLNCITLDCDTMNNCCNFQSPIKENIRHFKIPQIITEYGIDGISFVGSIDRSHSFQIYLNDMYQYRKYRKFNRKIPYVYINTAPDSEGMINGYVFNAPFLEKISVTGIFKDPRDIKDYMCCNEVDNMSALDSEIKDSLTKKKLYYYRQLLAQPLPNDQIAK